MKNKGFQTIEEVNEYVSGDQIQCLICNNWYVKLSIHIVKKHKMDTKDYKIEFNIPFKIPLAGQDFRSRAKKRAANFGLGTTIPGFRLGVDGRRGGREKGSIIPKLSTNLSSQGNFKKANATVRKDSVTSVSSECYKCGAEVIRTKHGLRILKANNRKPLCLVCRGEFTKKYNKDRYEEEKRKDAEMMLSFK